MASYKRAFLGNKMFFQIKYFSYFKVKLLEIVLKLNLKR